jgi:hypothetical protein
MDDPAESHPRHDLAEPSDLRPRKSAGAPILHGGRSKRVAALALPEQAEARAALQNRVAGILGDLGGIQAVSTVALGLVERHARLELVADYLYDRLVKLGPLTAKGNTRSALSNWLQLVDRLHRSAVTLGLERKQRRLDLAQAFAQQERDRG